MAEIRLQVAENEAVGMSMELARIIEAISPTATVTQTADGAILTVTDKNGTTSAEILNGDDGVTFTPSVSSAGVISWTNDGQRQNPSSVDLVAAVIAALPSAVGVSF